MNHLWSPFRQDTLFQSSPVWLEQPGILMPWQGNPRHDTLNASAPFALPALLLPLRESTPPLTDEHEPEDLAKGIERQLKALRKSPGFKLIADSALFLKACQLDMDAPPTRHHFVQQKLASMLTQKTGLALNPDQLQITFSTGAQQEHDSVRLSLTDVALATFDPPYFLALYRSQVTDISMPDDAPSISTAKVLKWIIETPWSSDYSAALNDFRNRHGETCRALSRLGLLDSLARQFARGRISRDGYVLTLDALGLSAFPVDAEALAHTGRGEKSEVRMLSLDGQRVPGIFQVRSKTTSHCFIHVLGAQRNAVEYISDDPRRMRDRLVAAMNASGLYGPLLHALEPDAESVADAPLIDGDVFTELTRAQASFADTLLCGDHYDSIDWLRPITRGLTLAGAVDLWQAEPELLDQIPVPATMAAQIMGVYLYEHHGLTLNPDHVFIAYQRGRLISPLGGPRTPATYTHSPDEKPLSLSEALMNNYRVDYPAGYIDHDGSTAVFLDTTGLGNSAQGQVLAIDPQALEDYIKAFDFLNWMTRHLNDFWHQQKTAIEQAFRSTFVAQALICLKQGSLTRDGFDRVVQTITTNAETHWRALGFFVQGSLIDGMEHQYTGLLMLDQPAKPTVLYQAGHQRAFVEFADAPALERYLNQNTADPEWRRAVLRYVPARHHSRLEYLFKLWGGAQAPDQPVSLLRPWTDALFNPDTRHALHHSLCKKELEGSPFVYLHQLLKQNTQDDADDQLVTSAHVSLAYWTARLQHLQSLLMPMSLLLTPAFIASLAAEIGITSLSIASAQLPGSRQTEKNQALLSTLSLGLMQLGPQTPRLLRTFRKLAKPAVHKARAALRSRAVSRSITPLRLGPIKPRQTRLEKFFHTDALLKRWTLNGGALPNLVPVHAWKLGRRFLLWTSDRGQARTLVVSTHGYYTPWTATVKIPNGTELRTYAPHGYELTDPGLHRVVNKNARPFALSSTAANTLMQPPPLEPLLITDKLMAGTSLPGRLKNYNLSKFQTTRDEPYDEIARVVRNSNASPLRGWLPPTPMDVLTVRKRFGMTPPSLADLFKSLSAQGIHYDRILLVHCRCAAISAVLRRAPVYHAPTASPAINRLA
ncbi:hypothetical protein BW686_00605 [Pseudomonas syringae]|uniref:Uncharacterized protein n=1 Tax=Pseudomonas syringae TaxID=317 RepID=A0A244EXT7_PSESX|nr:DUF6543 domain-containing protein [Pseudomonas syringae]OUM09228.1 hypothetical protein BW686_00605 [Pseudomonas syringae]